MTERTTITVPDLGDFADVEVIDVLVKPGDTVEPETPLITLETDKATMDVPSSAAGRVAEVLVSKGARVSKGDRILLLEPVDGSSEGAPEPATAAGPAAATGPATPPAKTGSGTERGQSGEQVVEVPELGDFRDVEVIEVLVGPGDEVAVDTPLITLETDKATMDVPSPATGTILELHVAKGARVNAGDRIATLRNARGSASPAPGASPEAPSAPREAPEPRPMARVEAPSGVLPPIEEAGFSRAHASPTVRRFARELGVDLGRVNGTGIKGRITREDVKAFVKAALAPGAATGRAAAALPAVPEVDFASFGPVETQPLNRIQRISGPRLHASWVNVPHVTQHEEADITELEELRGELKKKTAAAGVKVTPLAFILRACARIMGDFPRFNASLDPEGRNLVFKKYLHLGFAADTPNGLVVPVIRDADRKDVYELARDLATLSEKARGGKLAAADMQGGCFTVSSLGGIGGTAFTPIINAPEVAILGVSRSQWRPVWNGDSFIPRLMLPLSLSYDHRVIDGAEAARFVVALGAALSAPRSLIEAVP